MQQPAEHPAQEDLVERARIALAGIVYVPGLRRHNELRKLMRGDSSELASVVNILV